MDFVASCFFSVQNADDCRLLCRYARQLRCAVPYGLYSLFWHIICSGAHTVWKSLPGGVFGYTSRNYCYTGLRLSFHFPKHKREYHRVRQYLLRHGEFFSFSPDASLSQNQKKRKTFSGSHQRGIKQDNLTVRLSVTGCFIRKTFTAGRNEYGRWLNRARFYTPSTGTEQKPDMTISDTTWQSMTTSS